MLETIGDWTQDKLTRYIKSLSLNRDTLPKDVVYQGDIAGLGSTGPKITYSSLSVAPTNPANGDIWIADTGYIYDVTWTFVYLASAARWQFMGGPAMVFESSTNTLLSTWVGTGATNWFVLGGSTTTVARSGVYLFRSRADSIAPAAGLRANYIAGWNFSTVNQLIDNSLVYIDANHYDVNISAYQQCTISAGNAVTTAVNDGGLNDTTVYSVSYEFLPIYVT